VKISVGSICHKAAIINDLRKVKNMFSHTNQRNFTPTTKQPWEVDSIIEERILPRGITQVQLELLTSFDLAA